MALETHEQISVTVEGVKSRPGFDARIVLFALDRDYHKAAQSLLADGCTDVAIITTRVTWRGKNGKRHHEVIDRIPVTA